MTYGQVSGAIVLSVIGLLIIIACVGGMTFILLCCVTIYSAVALCYALYKEELFWIMLLGINTSLGVITIALSILYKLG